MTTFAFLLLVFTSDPFVADAQASASYTVERSRQMLKDYVDDIGLFERNMPGVVGVTPIGDGRYLYQTEKDLPLAGTMRTDFIIDKKVQGDSVYVYESVNPEDTNYMFCKVVVRPSGPEQTAITIQIRLRLVRESGSDVHWLAPILGQDFISNEMSKDLQEMLAVFVEKSNREMEEQLTRGGVEN